MNKKIASEIAIGIILLVTIIIGAVFYWQNKEVQTVVPVVSNKQPAINNQQMTSNNIVRIPVDTTNSYDTNRWITYANEKYGYSFKYPNIGWEIYGGDSNGTFDGDSSKSMQEELKNADWISIKSKISSDHSQDINVAPKEENDGLFGGTPNENYKEYKEIPSTFLGMDTDQITYSFISPENGKKESDNREISFTKNGYTYVIGGVATDYEKNGGVDEGILNAILSTFKFTNTTNETAIWQTYTNAKYGFELKYPNDWKIKIIPDAITEDDECYGETAPCNSLFPEKQKNCAYNEMSNGCVDNVKFGIIKNEKKLSFKDFLEKEYSLTKDSGTIKDNNIQQIKLGSGFIYKFTEISAFDGSEYSHFWVTLDDGNFFNMTGIYLDEGESKIFEQIISSFKFTK